jgi:hypothetical protein
MAKLKLQTESTESTQNLESVVLETRKVKALEKIANSLDALTIWFEEINKSEWSDRISYYLYEFYNMAKENSNNTNSQSNESSNSQAHIDTTQDAGELPPPRKVRPKKDIEKV